MGTRTKRATADGRPRRCGAPRPRRTAGPTGLDHRLRVAVGRAVGTRRVPPTEADDLVGDVLLSIARSPGAWTGRSSFRTWVWSVVRRRARDTWRRRAVERRALRELASAAAVAPRADGTPEQLAIHREASGRALALLRSLPRADAICFVLLRVVDWSAADVARTLGTTPGAVRVRACRVAAKLRASLEGPGSGRSVPPPLTHGHTLAHHRPAGTARWRRSWRLRRQRCVTIRPVALLAGLRQAAVMDRSVREAMGPEGQGVSKLLHPPDGVVHNRAAPAQARAPPGDPATVPRKRGW
ncbi:MAG: sigma-70 family RNA polymerase sigma factor [Deltaproteobacteria bacterium]|nr:sigma-70 family RNA polymerase sigma factor [Deltaproteobacteria bacterium]